MPTTETHEKVSPRARFAALPQQREEWRNGPRVVCARDGAPAAADEALIVDDRAALSPAQVVENKLSRMLKDASVPVSHLQMRRLLRSR